MAVSCGRGDIEQRARPLPDECRRRLPWGTTLRCRRIGDRACDGHEAGTPTLPRRAVVLAPARGLPRIAAASAAELDPHAARSAVVRSSAVWIRRARRSIRTLMASLAVVGSSLTRCPNARQLSQLPSSFLTA